MRLHTDKITALDIYAATKGMPGVFVTQTQHGSRSKDHAFEIRLEGNGYRRNTGNYGADETEYGATWDEWGVFIARLFAVDPDAFWGSAKYAVYASSFDFHVQTDDRFRDLEMPEDTHKRHNWESAGPRTRVCKSCTAYQSFPI